MAITASFSVSQSALTPNVITVTDTSTGTYGTITKRRIYFQTNEGTYLVETGVTTDYNEWPLANTTQSFDVLDEDMALSIRVDWLTAGDVVVNTLTQVYPLSRYNRNFFYYLIQQQSLTPDILRDSVYFLNLATYWMNIIGGINAIEDGADISASQNCFNRATNMMNEESKYF